MVRNRQEGPQRDGVLFVMIIMVVLKNPTDVLAYSHDASGWQRAQKFKEMAGERYVDTWIRRVLP